jgi:hypothetical protein
MVIKVELALILVAVLGQGLAQAGPYHDPVHHYSLTFPADWKVVSAKWLEMVNAIPRQRLPKSTIHYERGFQPANQGDAGYPYILVQIHPQNMSQYTYEDLERSLAQDFRGQVKKVEDAFADIGLKSELGRITLERARNRYLIPTESRVAIVGKIRGLSAGMIGSEGIVLLHFYAPAAEYDKYLPTFRAMVDSFHYDPGYAFVPRAPNVILHTPFDWQGTLGGCLLGAILVGGGVAICYGIKFGMKVLWHLGRGLIK